MKPDLFCAAGLGLMDVVAGFFSQDGLPVANASRTGSSRMTKDGAALPRPPQPDVEVISDALYIACRNGRLDAARFLLQRKADLNFRAYLGGTSLHWAYFSGNREVMNLLINSGANQELINYRYNCKPYSFGMMVLVSWGFKPRLDKLLKENPDHVHARSEQEYTLLHEAIRGRKNEIIDIFLKTWGRHSTVSMPKVKLHSCSPRKSVSPCHPGNNKVDSRIDNISIRESDYMWFRDGLITSR